MTPDTRSPGQRAGVLELTWHGVEQAVDVVAAEVDAEGAPEVIVGILRGGMVPAVMIAHRLAVRQVRAVSATRTVGEGPNTAKHPEPALTDTWGLGELAGGDVLLVDDVAGTGATVRAVSALIAAARPARLRRAALAVNTANWAGSSLETPEDLFDSVGRNWPGWIRFPWERP